MVATGCGRCDSPLCDALRRRGGGIEGDDGGLLVRGNEVVAIGTKEKPASSWLASSSSMLILGGARGARDS